MWETSLWSGLKLRENSSPQLSQEIYCVGTGLTSEISAPKAELSSHSSPTLVKEQTSKHSYGQQVCFAPLHAQAMNQKRRGLLTAEGKTLKQRGNWVSDLVPYYPNQEASSSQQENKLKESREQIRQPAKPERCLQSPFHPAHCLSLSIASSSTHWVFQLPVGRG